MMSRNRIALAASAILGVGIVTGPVASPSPAIATPGPALPAATTGLDAAAGGARTASAGPARIGLRRTSLGAVLVNGSGFTLYAFSRDGKRKDRCVTVGGCTLIWPVMRTRGTPHAGRGVKRSLLGTIKIRGGIGQVTYAGRPLYTYSGDASPGATSYVGVSQFGGIWQAVKAGGGVVG